MPLSTISNGESGLSARNKINAGFAAVDSLQTSVNNLPLPSSASVQTTNGNTASVATLSMGTYSTYTIEATVAAWDNTNDLAYGSQLFAVFANNGATVSQISTTDVYEKSAFSTATSHIILDANNPKLIVIGEASKTINWTINYSVTKI